MIQINELRIGNIVEQGVVIRIDEFCSVFKDGSSDYLNDLELEPIPLTESILLQCGFEKNITTDLHPTFSKGAFNVNDGVVYIIGFGFVNHIKHLHQLQNLYFALTGIELPIDINTLKI